MTERRKETPEERAAREEAERVARIEKRISYLVQLAETQQESVAALDTQLKSAKSTLAELVENQIPDAIDELRGKKVDKDTLTLPDGTLVKVEPDFKGFISAANKEAALKWLVDNKLGGLIKTRITIEFGRNEDAMARRFAEIVRGSVAQYPVEVIIHEDAGETEMVKKVETLLQSVVLAREIEVTPTVHGSTLKAFIKAQFKTGKNWPSELFGAFERRVTKIKRPGGAEVSVEESAEAEAATA